MNDVKDSDDYYCPQCRGSDRTPGNASHTEENVLSTDAEEDKVVGHLAVPLDIKPHFVEAAAV